MSDQETCCSTDEAQGFNVDAIVTVDERGQMVLPKDLRARAGIKAGDKFALISWEKDGEVCCMSLVKTNALSSMVREFLGPMMSTLSTT